MGVRIGLARQGRKKHAHYRIRVMDTRYDVRSGNFIQDLGYHDPLSPIQEGTSIDLDAVAEWVAKGAKPSSKVQHILKALQPKQAPKAPAKKAAPKKASKPAAKKAAPKKDA